MSKYISGLLLLGIVVLVLGGTADIVYHAALAVGSGHQHGSIPLLGPDGERAHLVTLMGMVLTLAGVVARGAQRTRR
jgi:hypothetical protein